MPTIHFTTGLPASGKTTYAMELLRQSNGSMRRVNLDDIRAMLDDHGDGRTWSHKHEATAQAVQEAAVSAAVKDGFDVVVDNTHLTPRMPGRLKQVLGHFDDLTFVVHDFTDVPLAECLVRGEKRVENRTRRTHYRGRLLIHAGLGEDRNALPEDLTVWWPGVRGAVIGVAELVGCHQADRCCRPWGFHGTWHWELRDVRPLREPVQAKGALGLWKPDIDLLAAVEAQYTDMEVAW